MKIKVAIYEDNNNLREILTAIIEASSEFELIAAYSDCKKILPNTTEKTPHVIIMDIDLPGKTGIEAVRELKPKFPHVEVIMNTVFDDDDRIFQSLEAGATGYLLKKDSLSNLIHNIKDVYNGGAPMSQSIARRVLRLPFAKPNSASKHNLTDRELEIISVLAEGLSYKMAAEKLFISIDTVRSHIKKIYDKLHVHSVTEAVHKVFIEK